MPSDGFSHATTLRSFDGRLAFRGAWAFDRSGTLLGVHWQMGGREGVGRCAPPAHCSALLVSTLPPPIPSQPARFVPIISSSPLHTPLQIHTLRASTAAVLCLQHFFRIPTRRHSYILAHSLARSARHQPRTLKRHDIQNLATRRRTSLPPAVFHRRHEPAIKYPPPPSILALSTLHACPLAPELAAKWVAGRLRSRPSRMTEIAQCTFQAFALRGFRVSSDGTDQQNRTFLKRKGGLFKKAHELSVLCSVDVAVIIFGHNKKLYEFSSGDIQETLGRYSYVRRDTSIFLSAAPACPLPVYQLRVFLQAVTHRFVRSSTS